MLQKLEILFKVIGIVWCCSQFDWKKACIVFYWLVCFQWVSLNVSAACCCVCCVWKDSLLRMKEHGLT